MSVYRALHEEKLRKENEDTGKTVSRFRPLHLAAAFASPPCLFPLVVNVYREELSEKNKDGRLPLSIACDCPIANRSCDVLTKIQILLREYPDAARVIDVNRNTFPIFIALSSGILWNDGIE